MASPIQVTLVTALEDLGFQRKEPDAGAPLGGPAEVEVTEKTLEGLKGLIGKTVEVDSGGKVSVV
ncbi:hypothetical protein [Crateriforma spongiae]|uniref:hypothetical protein n=1 Tax=Crateriforma spongiae TaxID=2724528 RepID=UPI00144710CD|nr:hypothetical protein [Crateriforma spongiae]